MARILLVDDEAPARKRLQKLLSDESLAGLVSSIDTAADGDQALEKVSAGNVDALFLDIQMPGLDGFDVLDRIDPDHRPVVVFTTAFDEYAIRAFDANAIDYLLKPVTSDRLQEALKRVHKAMGTSDDQGERLAKLLEWMDSQAMQNADGPAESGDWLEQLSIPYRDRILIIPIDSVVSIEIAEGITRVYILEEDPNALRPRLRQHIVNYTLDQLGSMLDPEHFMRVHRSAIVQFSHIKELIPWFSGRYKLALTGGHEVIASRERSKAVKERLKI
ncbi:MAG: LytTR family DNA-binding domain-containing protein [Bacteroidota bacterium]|nr:LytTR family DNA-binding domain-containing protein [Bacteroidota bacterium]